MINKILDAIISIFIIVGLIIVMVDIIAEIYERIKITNKIENPAICIKINDDYYCKAEEKQQTKASKV